MATSFVAHPLLSVEESFFFTQFFVLVLSNRECRRYDGLPLFGSCRCQAEKPRGGICLGDELIEELQLPAWPVSSIINIPLFYIYIYISSFQTHPNPTNRNYILAQSSPPRSPIAHKADNFPTFLLSLPALFIPSAATTVHYSPLQGDFYLRLDRVSNG